MKWITLLLFTCNLASCALLQQDTTKTQKHKSALHLKIGSSHFQNRKFHSALKEYISAHDLDPTNPVALNNLGITYFALNRLPIAEQYIRKALSFSPEYTEARLNLAKVQIQMGIYAEALENLRICEDDLTYPYTDQVNYNMGLALFKMEQFAVAEERLKIALKKNPKHCLATFFYGRSLFELKSYLAASESLDSSIALCEELKLDAAHFYSALSHYRLNNLKTTSARLHELIELYPNTEYLNDANEILKILQ